MRFLRYLQRFGLFMISAVFLCATTHQACFIIIYAETHFWSRCFNNLFIFFNMKLFLSHKQLDQVLSGNGISMTQLTPKKTTSYKRNFI